MDSFGPTVEWALKLAPAWVDRLLARANQLPAQTWAALGVVLGLLLTTLFYGFVAFVAPVPREPLQNEQEYITSLPDGTSTSPQRLPSWYAAYLSDLRREPLKKPTLEQAEVQVSLVVPAFNEQQRIRPMLEEAIEFLTAEYPTSKDSTVATTLRNRSPAEKPRGWEILVVSDGSTDKTGDVVLEFAKQHPAGSIRLVTLVHNRGKGGAVVHGMRHVRGQYVIFADADGASKFADLRKLIAACDKAKDSRGRAVAVGSRAHLVGSEAVVQRSKLRNFLMHSFHLLLWALTPPATSRIKDTQCGFKLFSRDSLPDIIPHMHSEGWIFDVEMLMLAESAQIPMVEVPVGWKEVTGSKLNVLWDSLGMAWGLAILRIAWAIGVYKL